MSRKVKVKWEGGHWPLAGGGEMDTKRGKLRNQSERERESKRYKKNRR